MSKKKRPNKTAPAQPATPPDPWSLPVAKRDVFVSFIEIATSFCNELNARRAFDREVAEFLGGKGLTEEFEAWRKARAPANRG